MWVVARAMRRVKVWRIRYFRASTARHLVAVRGVSGESVRDKYSGRLKGPERKPPLDARLAALISGTVLSANFFQKTVGDVEIEPNPFTQEDAILWTKLNPQTRQQIEDKRLGEIIKEEMKEILDVDGEDAKWKNSIIPRETLQKAMEDIRARRPPLEHSPVKTFLKIPLKLAMYPVFGLFYGVSIIGWLLGSFTSRFKASFRPKQGDVGELRPVLGVQISKKATQNEQADFQFHRMPAYFATAVFGTANGWIDYLTGCCTYDLLSDDEVAAAMLCSGMGRDVQWSQDKKKIFVPFDQLGLKNLTLYRGFYLDCWGWELDTETKKMKLRCRKHVKQDDENSPEDRGSYTISQDDPKWDLAKAHWAGTFGTWIPAMTHNWVHFYYQDLACCENVKTVAPNSVLGKLLAKHLRFTAHINVQGPSMALFKPQGEQDKRTWWTIWKVSPLSQQQFQSNIVQNAIVHYINFGSELESHKRENPLEWTTEDAFPPKFVRQRSKRFDIKEGDFNPDRFCYDPTLLRKIPYLDMLAEYYAVIYNFVWELDEAELIEKDLVETWQLGVHSSGMYKFTRVHYREALATLIWTGAIVHGMDHFVHGQFQQSVYFSTMVPFKIDGTPEEVLSPRWLSNPQWQHARSRLFWDWFVKYHPSWFIDDTVTAPNLYNQWTNIIMSHENREKICEISDRFQHNLRVVNEKWNWIEDVQKLPASTSF